MPQPILFDMDGVLLEGPGTHPQVYADAADAALDELEADPTPTQRADLRRNDLENVADHCEALGIDPARFWQLKERYASQGTHDRLRAGERGLYDDIDAIEALAERTTVGLVTNNRHETAEFVADYVGIDFEVVRGRDPTLEGYRRRKPEPDYIEDALDELGSSEGLYVGDSIKDVTAGRAAGLETAFLRRSHNRGLDRPAEATLELESLAALTDIV
ncbi:HAD family hydrolase [Haloterrigena salifodinae]|uniref:HAD family hydrolase n=1 Tax=Haloterrigena salifodinae TaxID=2675099 RepID=UPI000F87BB6B|nr:HAD-IA family hydrolase [Haloterrigena salifodinae]